MPTIISVMDIIIRFNTAFYDNGQLVTEKKLIIIRYYKGFFDVDITTSMILILNQSLSY